MDEIPEGAKHQLELLPSEIKEHALRGSLTVGGSLTGAVGGAGMDQEENRQRGGTSMRDATMEARADSYQAATENTENDEQRKRPQIFTGHLFRVRDGHGWAFSDEPPKPPPAPVRRPARVAQMLALAHRLEAAIDRGDYRDRADVARQLGFTRGRITQLMDLTLLAPDIQEQVLDLEAVDEHESITGRGLRKVVGLVDWGEQREVLRDLNCREYQS